MLLGTITGILGGALQDGLSYIKETKAREQNFKHEASLEKIRSENKVREFQAGIEIAKEQTKQADFSLQNEKQKTYGIKAKSDAGVEIARYDNITKATNYIAGVGLWVSVANFFIATARPVITYLLGFLMFWIIFHHHDFKDTPQWLQNFITMIAFQFEATVSFWFYRRGSEKISDFQNQKKK